MERDLNDLKEEIKARTDIVAVIGQYTRLTRAGKSWKGLCPFHNDRKPSFSVNPQLGFYTCFSCGEKGDIITFVQKKENLEFVEALEELARRAGIPFERRAPNPEKASEREEALALNRLAVEYFQNRLAKSQIAQDYLANRALLKPTQDQWEIGFAPDDWEGLVFYFEQKKVNLGLAAKLGLIKERKAEGRGYYDAFRNRLMFPIHDVNGRVIAFGGRAMGDDPAKYLNSEQSSLFDKSRTLYGLHLARKRLSGDTPAVFVEGYVDVIATHQAGFSQCVATLGTSMTEEHARMLARYSPKVIICYDADSAGVKATLRGASVWESVGVEGAEVRVARLPAGDDPDSLLRRGETAAFQAALDHAVPRVDFQLELALKPHDLHTPDGRADALAEVIPILATIPKLSVRQRHAADLARLHPLHDRLGIGRAIDAILADTELYAKQSNNGQSPRDRGYPLTQDANRGPTQQQPPPPTYRPPNRDQWGRMESFPNTRDVKRAGGYNERRNDGNRRKDRTRNGPFGDPTPPPLEAPLLTGVEKAERQLLRACFSPDWRATTLSHLTAEDMATPQGARLFELLARTPADAEGGIDPRRVLEQVLRQEEQGVSDVAAALQDAERQSEHFQGRLDQAEPPEEDPFANETLPEEYQTEVEVANAPDESPARAVLPQSAKLSWFIREIAEDFGSRLANEPLNEAVVKDCIRRLKRHRVTRLQQELAEILRQANADALPPEQVRAYIELYQQKTRELRGVQNDSIGG